MDQERAHEEEHPGAVEGGQPAAGARREQEQDACDGEELQVADVAAVGPDAAIGAPVGGVEAACVAEHVGVGGKADAAQDQGRLGQAPGDGGRQGVRPGAVPGGGRPAAEQDAGAQAERADQVEGLDVDEVALVEEAAQLAGLRKRQHDRQGRIEIDQHRADVEHRVERVAMLLPGEEDEEDRDQAGEVGEDGEGHGPRAVRGFGAKAPWGAAAAMRRPGL